jgi:hypothetical protein
VCCGSNSVGRVPAFQAGCRGFESRLPLQSHKETHVKLEVIIPTEKIIGSLVGVSGHTFDIIYDLFFTTERVIAVSIQHPADSLRPTSVWQTMFVGSFWSAGREELKRKRTAQEKRLSLQTMTPEELASANPRSFAVPCREIASAEITRSFFQSQLRFRLSGTPARERIVHFNLTKKQVPEAQRLLELASLSEND